MQRILASGLLSCAASLAVAAGDSWYIGGALGQSAFGDCAAAMSCDSRDDAYKVYAGYRFSAYLAAEAGYTDLGKASARSGMSLTESKPRGGAAHLVGSWPLSGEFSLLGRVGFIYGDTKVTGGGDIRNPKGTGLAWGVGAQYAPWRRLFVRLEWERLRFEPFDVDALTLGVGTTF